MDFRRDNRFYITQQYEDQFASRSSSFLLPSSSSSSSPTAPPFSWRNPDNSTLEKEHMFDKVVTPSDVGKLNRLVIPKQHAEKYFPLNSATNEKGLLLCFEDRTGKSWRFRYSYWNSSQSYVMTKGWSRFVKEKRLDAGDTVSFGRGVGDAAAQERLFIDWRRRPEILHHQPPAGFQFPRTNFPPFPRSVVGPWNGGVTTGRLFAPPAIPCNYPNNYLLNSSSLSSSVENAQHQLLYYATPATSRAAAMHQHLGNGRLPTVLDSVPVVQNPMAAKRVRLFGVNLDSSDSEEMGRDLQLQTAMSTTTTLQLMDTTSFGVETPGASSSSSTNKGRSLSFDLEL